MAPLPLRHCVIPDPSQCPTRALLKPQHLLIPSCPRASSNRQRGRPPAGADGAALAQTLQQPGPHATCRAPHHAAAAGPITAGSWPPGLLSEISSGGVSPVFPPSHRIEPPSDPRAATRHAWPPPGFLPVLP